MTDDEGEIGGREWKGIGVLHEEQQVKGGVGMD